MDCSFNTDYYKMVEAMRYFFARREANSNGHSCKNKGDYNPNDLNFPQVQYCITYLSHLKEYFSKSWPYDMNGSRILIALNHDSNNCSIKVVDKSKTEQKKSGDEVRTFADGLNSILRIL